MRTTSILHGPFTRVKKNNKRMGRIGRISVTIVKQMQFCKYPGKRPDQASREKSIKSLSIFSKAA